MNWTQIEAWMLSYGEDAQVAIFFSVLVIMLIVERLLRFRVPSGPQGHRWLTNAGLTMTAIAALPLLPVSLIAAGYWAEENNLGLMNHLQLPVALAVLVQLLLRGLLSFVTHFLNHHVPWLWRIHRVHHLDRELDASSTVRFHPLEMPVSALIAVPLVVLLGLDPWILLAYELLDAAVVIFSHSNISLPDRINRWLCYLVVTPNLHRVHHSVVTRETNSNFSAVFPVWDVLFGTFRRETEHAQQDMHLGLDEVRDERTDSFLWLLSSPFRDIKGRSADADPAIQQT